MEPKHHTIYQAIIVALAFVILAHSGSNSSAQAASQAAPGHYAAQSGAPNH